MMIHQKTSSFLVCALSLQLLLVATGVHSSNQHRQNQLRGGIKDHHHHHHHHHHRALTSTVSWNDGPATTFSTNFPLGHCQGDCDNDDECDGDLVCDNTRDHGIPKPVPGCSISPDEDSGTDFCVKPEDLNGGGGSGGGTTDGSSGGTTSTTTSSPTSSPMSGGSSNVLYDKGVDPTGTLGRCEGDCDDDSQCSTGYCFQRDNNEAVPGCSFGGNEKQGHDYCTDESYRDSSGRSSTSTGGSGTTTATNTDDDDGVLDYDDTSGGPLVWIANNPIESDANNKLELCEGDCDSDYTCGQGLMCWHRNGSENIPGCQNGGAGDIAGKDYCVLEKYRGTDGDQFYFPNDDVFRLKLFWQQGYTWQEESFERRWCIECLDGSCGAGSLIFLSECSLERNVLMQFVNVGNGYVLVKLASGGDRCWDRTGNVLSWESCDANDTNQHWLANNGSFTDSQFEIKPRNDEGHKCVTQRHHPKDAEWLALESCVLARHDETTYWNKY